MNTIDFALLAPVPDEHLEPGMLVAAETGHVCFGSNRWDVFKQLDANRNGEDVPVLIYPSQEGTESKLTLKVCYIGWYAGQANTIDDMRREDADGHRPRSVDEYRKEWDDPGVHWGLFWKVKELRRLPEGEQVALSTLSNYKSGKKRLNTAPLGPTVVARPSWI